MIMLIIVKLRVNIFSTLEKKHVSSPVTHTHRYNTSFLPDDFNYLPLVLELSWSHSQNQPFNHGSSKLCHSY